MNRLLIILFLAGSFAGGAQAPYNFYHLFLDKGLSDARVADIVQDKYGFMWFATPNGLNRYDGYSMKTFYVGQSHGLPSNNIISLYASRTGDLWIGTANGVVRYDFAKEKFLPFDTAAKESAEIAKVPISDFEEDKAGNIYVACASGVYRYLIKEKTWQDINSLLSPKGALRRIRRLKFFTDDVLYATTSGNIPVFEINIKTRRYDSVRITIADTCCPNMYGIEKINDRELLAGSLSYGVQKILPQTKGFALVPGVLSRSESIRYNTVYDILKDSRGRI